MISTLSIMGLRGFATKQTANFALPSIAHGRIGLTIIVGQNNSGKSTLLEAIRVLVEERPSFSEGKRNRAKDRVLIEARDDKNGKLTLKSVAAGGSETMFEGVRSEIAADNVLMLPSRRAFPAYFGRNESNRRSYMSNIISQPPRHSTLDSFTQRLFRINANRAAFNSVLYRVIGRSLDWSIDQSDQGQYFLKIKGDSGGKHSSEGMGEGLISLLFIVDALYDSQPGQTIVVDEPELSLHPSYQRRLSDLILEYAKDRQIILSTHSPYFVDLEGGLNRGMRLIRVCSSAVGSEIHELSDAVAAEVYKLIGDSYNPHTMGIVAREVLFLDDNLLLLEGQEDVVHFGRVESDLSETVRAERYGWGVGGASKMATIARLLKDLGFQKVVGLLDANEAGRLADLRKDFPSYYFDAIPADDIRSKPAIKARAAVEGLLDVDNLTVRQKYRDATLKLLQDANAYLKT